MLSSDGKVAEQGSYAELSGRPDGAFTKLMEWQMSGGDVVTEDDGKRPEPEEGEELMHNVEEGGTEAEGGGDGEGSKVRGKEQSKGEAVLEKVEPGLRKS